METALKKAYHMDKTRADYRQRFYKLYNTTIKPLFAYYEKERKSILYRAILYSSLCIILALIIGFNAFSHVDSSPFRRL